MRNLSFGSGLVVFFLLIGGFSGSLFSQNALQPKIDSLKAIIENAKIDSVKVNAMFAWDDLIYISDVELDFKLNREIEQISNAALTKKLGKAETRFFTQAKARSLNNIGIIYKEKSDYAKATIYFVKSLALQRQLNNKKGIANCYNNLGIVSYERGDNKKAINYYMQSLKINESMNNGEAIAGCFNNIGIIYQEILDYERALGYFKKAAVVMDKIKNKHGLGQAYNNIGSTLSNLKRYREAQVYIEESLRIGNEIGDKYGVANSYGNLALTYKRQNKYDTAILYNVKSLEIEKELGNVQGVASSLNNLGIIYKMLGDEKKAISYCEQALKIGMDIGVPVEISTASFALFDLYKRAGRYKEALLMFNQYIVAKDSISSQVSHKELVRQEIKYNYEKKALADSIRNAEERKVAATALKEKQTQRYALYMFFILTLVFGIFMFNRFRTARNQKMIIEKQKELVQNQKLMVEEKQKEVMDSIHYAKRIQQALMPSDKAIEKDLKRLKDT